MNQNRDSGFGTISPVNKPGIHKSIFRLRHKNRRRSSASNKIGQSPYFAKQGDTGRLLKRGAANGSCKHTNDRAAPCEAIPSDNHVHSKAFTVMRLQAHAGTSALQAQSKSPAQPVVLIAHKDRRVSLSAVQESQQHTFGSGSF